MDTEQSDEDDAETLSVGSDHSEASLEERVRKNTQRKRKASEAENDDANSYTVFTPEGKYKIAFDAPLPVKKPSYQGGNGEQHPYDKREHYDFYIKLDEDIVLGDNIPARLQTIADGIDEMREWLGIEDEFFTQENRALCLPWLMHAIHMDWAQFVSRDDMGKKESFSQLNKSSYEIYYQMRTFLYQLTKINELHNEYAERVTMLRKAIESTYLIFFRMVTDFHTRFNAWHLFFNGDECSYFSIQIPYDLYEDVLPILDDETNDSQPARTKQNDLLFVKDTLRRLAKESMLKRLNRVVMKPKYYDGVFTWSYTNYMDVEDWINKKVQHQFGRKMYEAIEGSKGNASEIRTYFAERGGLSDLQISRYHMSFQNGVYFVLQDKFVLHKNMSVDLMPAPNVYCCMYYDKEFNYYEHLRNVHLPFPTSDTPGPPVYGTVYDIPTPALDKIMLDQEWSYEVRCMMYYQIGRCLFDQDFLDADQQAMFNQGRRETGKSTICRVVEKIYPRQKVTSCTNKTEGAFALQDTLESYLLLNPEVSSAWNLEPTDFMKMIAGDTMKVARKYKQPVDLVWRAVFVLAGNDIMNWNDDHGAIMRRLVLFKFWKKIVVDQSLDERLENELPQIILKCVRYYLARVHCWPNKKIPLPAEFLENRRALLKQTSPIFDFLTSKELVPCEGCSVPFQQILQNYKEFIKTRGGGKKVCTQIDTWRVMMEELEMDLTKEEEERVWPPDQENRRVDFYLNGYETASRYYQSQNAKVNDGINFQ